LTLYGLIGYPLGHSFSVPYFTEKFAKEGIDAQYRNFPLEKISDFETLVKNESGLTGLNVTVPYKQAIMPYLDALDRTARSVRAVNTIFFCRREGRLTLLGYNTDVTGFERSLKEHLQPHHRKALVLGTGGSSKAVVYVLERLGIDYVMVSRKECFHIKNWILKLFLSIRSLSTPLPLVCIPTWMPPQRYPIKRLPPAICFSTWSIILPEQSSFPRGRHMGPGS
jgi:shikimate 5-dehydrogenase